jgi:hypothetical protein
MSEMLTPYIERVPGDLISAEDWNAIQVKMQQDLANKVGQVQKALNEHMQALVNAATIGGKSIDEIRAELDQRYVRNSDLNYSGGKHMRYFKEIEAPVKPVIIEHNMGKFPVVNVFELTTLEGVYSEPGTESEATQVKFLVYYAGATDRAARKLITKGTEEKHWGDPLTFWLELFGMNVTPTQAFADVLNDLWDKMFDTDDAQDHFDQGKFGHTSYIQKEMLDKNRTVENLRAGGFWDNLRVAIRPQLLSPNQGEGSVQVFHISHKVLEVQVPEPMDLMVVLRT